METHNFQSIITEYDAYLQGEKRIARTTREGYLSVVRSWYQAVAANPAGFLLPPDWEWPQVDKRALEIYIRHFREIRGWKDVSIRFQASALRGFFQFLRDRGHIDRNPVRSLMPPRVAVALKAPEGDEVAVRKLFARRAGTMGDARLLAVLELIYGGGLKPAHAYRVANITIRKEEGLALVELESGGGLESMEVPVSPAGRRRLTRYLAFREEIPTLPSQAAPFWIDSRGRALLPATLARHVAKAMEAVQLTGGGSALRQLAAKHFKARGGDIRSIKRFLGLKRLDALRRYEAPDYKEMADQFRRFHPRGRDKS